MVIVDFTVEHKCQVTHEHWLFRPFGQIDNGQAPVAKSRALVLPDGAAIGTAVANEVKRINECLVVKVITG